MINKLAQFLVIAILFTLACTTIVYSITKTLDPSGGIDFHSYWYSGHFVIQGIDPYRAYLENLLPKLPVQYLDGIITERPPIAQPGLANVPANTAPMVLLLSLLTYFSWPAAKLLWMVGNLILVFIIPLFTLKLLPQDQSLNNFSKAVIYLAFLGLFGTRNTVASGQTSLLIFATMLLALLQGRRSWLAGGIWLGFALSKYSLSLPIFIYFILAKRYRLLITSLIVQFLGAAVLGLITHTTPIKIIGEYLEILKIHTNLPGIHLANLFEDSPYIGLIAVILLTIVTGIVLVRWYRLHPSVITEESWYGQISSNHIINILLLWTLLAAYHRAYDLVVTILFIALVIYCFNRSTMWQLTRRQRIILGLYLAVTYVILISPARGITYIPNIQSVLSQSDWLRLQGSIVTLTLLSMFAVTILLFRRIRYTEG